MCLSGNHVREKLSTAYSMLAIITNATHRDQRKRAALILANWRKCAFAQCANVATTVPTMRRIFGKVSYSQHFCWLPDNIKEKTERWIALEEGENYVEEEEQNTDVDITVVARRWMSYTNFSNRQFFFNE